MTREEGARLRSGLGQSLFRRRGVGTCVAKALARLGRPTDFVPAANRPSPGQLPLVSHIRLVLMGEPQHGPRPEVDLVSLAQFPLAHSFAIDVGAIDRAQIEQPDHPAPALDPRVLARDPAVHQVHSNVVAPSQHRRPLVNRKELADAAPPR